MRSRTTEAFRLRLRALPADIRERARKAYQRFALDPGHPSLRFKKVHAALPVFSARVSSDCRALAIVEGDEAVWFWIGNHADYDRLLKGL